MILESGNKVLVAHRRLFRDEDRRFFVGEVLAYEAGIAKLHGYSFVIDTVRGLGLRKRDPRITLISLQAGTLITYQLPDDTDLETAKFELVKARSF